jgi:serine/threonine protein kinase
MPLNPDDTLSSGPYCILRLLGRGGYGCVYQAQAAELKRLQAASAAELERLSKAVLARVFRGEL